jgi:hypothetical protein
MTVETLGRDLLVVAVAAPGVRLSGGRVRAPDQPSVHGRPGNAAGTAYGGRSGRSNKQTTAAHTLDEREATIMDNGFTSGLDVVGCPACPAPAEVVDRYVLESTDGPIEHATVVCAVRHRFTVLVERLATHAAGRNRDGWAALPLPALTELA